MIQKIIVLKFQIPDSITVTIHNVRSNTTCISTSTNTISIGSYIVNLSTVLVFLFNSTGTIFQLFSFMFHSLTCVLAKSLKGQHY
jgi:hypothetical protein